MVNILNIITTNANRVVICAYFYGFVMDLMIFKPL